jgi:hypothetical protein
MAFDPRTALEPIAAGAALVCAAGCGCGGGCGGGCGCGGGYGCGGGCGAGADLGQPAVLPVAGASCSDRTWFTCPSGQVGYSAGGDPSGGILDSCNALIAAQYSQILASFLAAETPCGSVGAILRVNLSVPLANRSLMVQFALPSAGSLDPRPLFTYTSANSGTTGEFGNGWTNAYKRSVTLLGGGNVNVNTGTGAVQGFTNRNACKVAALGSRMTGGSSIK